MMLVLPTSYNKQLDLAGKEQLTMLSTSLRSSQMQPQQD